MKKINVLIFPAGGENSINVFDSLKYNIHFNLFGISSIEDYAKEIYKEDNYCVGNFNINDVDFINNLNNYLINKNIEYIIPTHDTISLFLMKNQKKINAKIVCSPYETAEIANSKIKIFENVKEKFYCPKIYNKLEKINDFPVFLKPDVGAGAKGTFLAKTKKDLSKFLKNNEQNFLICEYLPGDELTVDCFTNNKGELLFIGPRTRERITMGISFESKSVDLTDEIKLIANDLNDTFKFSGAWFFQIKKDKNNKWKLMEFSVRQAGTMALYRQLGVNFALLSLFNEMGLDLNILFNNYQISLSRRLSNSYKLNYYYDNIYIDFDDTLIINEKVNTLAIRYIYQCLNKNKNIYLITKHNSDIYVDLEKYHIDKNIFKKIILLNEREDKYKYIESKNSIFIDNYYKERIDVYNNLKIPVFDVDSIECLIDHSEV